MAPRQERSHTWGEQQQTQQQKPFTPPSIVALRFSFHHPLVSSDSDETVSQVILDPILELVICGGGFVVQNEESSSNECARFQSLDGENNVTSSSVSFDDNLTVLRRAPIFVQDRQHFAASGDLNDTIVLQWTSWTVYFHILQFGKQVTDMALMGGGSEMSSSLQKHNNTATTVITNIYDTEEGGIRIHFGASHVANEENIAADTTDTITMESLVQNILQLALQVNIMEGNVDAAIDPHLPGARYSLPGQELEKFASSSFDRNSTQQSSSTAVINDNEGMPSSMSMIAMSMYTSHAMRNFGIGMLLTTILVLGILLCTAKRRRVLQREREHLSEYQKDIRREEEAIPNHVMLDTNQNMKRRTKGYSTLSGSSIMVLLEMSLLLSIVRTTSATDVSRRTPPNFVIILTDDLDWTLGGANATTLTRTRQLIAEEGKTFSNWFVQTPVCCPSRAELLTGKLFHNLKSSNNTSSGCMHINVTDDASHAFYSRDYFAPYFSHDKTLQYSVGVFGKHLNNYNPTDFMLPGVDEMLINGGGAYLDPAFTYGSGTDESVQPIHFNSCVNFTGLPCYSTSVIGNVSLGWIERHVKGPKNLQPFMTLISVKAPHIQDSNGYSLSISAPWYANTSIEEEWAPRTPNYNYSGSPDHHWLVRSQSPLTQEEGAHIDELYVSRLKTLISVDDLVEELVQKLEKWNVLNNTYIIFTSDNGYRLGQFRMPMCKLHPYENDIRVPMMIRGPGIARNSSSSLVSTHVNLMPTIMGLATGQHDSQEVVPDTMDGMNLAASFTDQSDKHDGEVAANNLTAAQTSSVLVEYASLGNVVRYNHLVDTYNHSFVCLRILDTESAHYPLRNIKYIEFRDIRKDWDMTGRPLEKELYDLDIDPFEMYNIANEVPHVLVEALSEKIQRMLHCKGESCREEQATGLHSFWRKGQQTVS